MMDQPLPRPLPGSVPAPRPRPPRPAGGGNSRGSGGHWGSVQFGSRSEEDGSWTSHQPPAQLSHQRVYRAGPAQSSAGLAQISWGLVGLNTCPSSLLPRLYSSLSALSCYIIIQ